MGDYHINHIIMILIISHNQPAFFPTNQRTLAAPMMKASLAAAASAADFDSERQGGVGT